MAMKDHRIQNNTVELNAFFLSAIIVTYLQNE